MAKEKAQEATTNQLYFVDLLELITCDETKIIVATDHELLESDTLCFYKINLLYFQQKLLNVSFFF